MRVIGLMSGTSMDGIDAALLDTDGEFQISRLKTTSLSYPPDFKLALKNAENTPFEKSIERDSLIKQSSEYHATLVEKLLHRLEAFLKSIDLIGYHGQTLYHNPAKKITLQIGDPQILANRCQLPVVYDFRTQDILHGGQGAPLAPLYHQALMIQKKLNNLVFINCGGIANISIIAGHRYEDIRGGFDTGPGNVLLDRFTRKWTDGKYLMDINGEFAKAGKIDHGFLEVLYHKTTKNHYYDQSPPKSLDSRDIIFIDEIEERFPKNNVQSLNDGCATLAAFTAYTIVKSIPDFCKHAVISGGGAKNPAILESLKSFLPHTHIQTADDMGWSTTYMEAELIAWLAVRSIKKLPLSVPQTTGVKEPQTGGQCVYPQ